MCVCVYAISSLSTHLLMIKYLGCYHVLTIVNNVVNIGADVFFIFPDTYPGIELIEHMVVLFLGF